MSIVELGAGRVLAAAHPRVELTRFVEKRSDSRLPVYRRSMLEQEPGDEAAPQTSANEQPRRVSVVADLRGLALNHFGLIFSAFSIVLVSIKLTSVSHGSVNTMLAILSTGGTVPTTISLTLSTLPYIVAVAWCFGSYDVLATAVYSSSRSFPTRLVLASVLGLLLLVLLAPLQLVLYSVTVFLVFSFAALVSRWLWTLGIEQSFIERTLKPEEWQSPEKVRLAMRQYPGPGSFPERNRSILVGYVLLLVVASGAIILVIDEMWLPSENIAMASGEPVVGYVLSESDDIVVLTNDNRKVIHLEKADLRSRTICTIERDPETLATWLLYSNDGPEYPDCDT
ncbi:MAG TPA: hypothetical protein VJM33_16310 [Microthrixaceae bacterium]|nr:hypothetical protein [Microthrixaceae bacterium]